MGLIEDGKSRGRIRERGAAMVEMVFLLPVVCMLIFAIAEFGIAFGQWQTINNAAREGARLAIVYRAGCNSAVPSVEDQVRTTVDNYASAMGGIASGDVTVDFAGTDVCGASGTPVTVNATLPYTFTFLPDFSDAWGDGNFVANINLTASSTMRNE